MKKLFICVLALLMLVPLMAACDNEGDDNSKVSVDPNAISLTTPVIDLGNREINILCVEFAQNSILGYTGEIIYSEDDPSAVDVAKKEVVAHIEEQYNCRIEGDLIEKNEYNNTIKNQVTSGLHHYDIGFADLENAATLAMENYLLDLSTIPGIDLSKPWWDKNAVADLSIGGKTYFTCGDINTYDDQGTWCILFNKKLKDKYLPDEDLYKIARDGDWTYDKFVELCTENDITNDSNGDGNLDEADTWAFGTETYNIYVHVVGAGQKIAQKDEITDLPYLTVSKSPEATYTIISKVLEFYNDQNTVMVANASPYIDKYPPATSNPWEETVHKSFIEGRELFYMCGLINVASFRQMEDEFGILPIPKYYDSQDRYYHTVSINNASFMSIPASLPASEYEKLGTVISAISELSKQKVTPAYYDIQLKYRDAKDDESAEMLDLIFASRTFDLGSAYNWGSILYQYMSMDSNVASRFDANIERAEKALQNQLDKFKK